MLTLNLLCRKEAGERTTTKMKLNINEANTMQNTVKYNNYIYPVDIYQY